LHHQITALLASAQHLFKALLCVVCWPSCAAGSLHTNPLTTPQQLQLQQTGYMVTPAAAAAAARYHQRLFCEVGLRAGVVRQDSMWRTISSSALTPQLQPVSSSSSSSGSRHSSPAGQGR
jgi:hypothetical protein